MKVFIITMQTVELIICGYESQERAEQQARSLAPHQDIERVEEVTGPTILMREVWEVDD